ncbi:Uma2 family endonuclease [Chamaesiphon sp. VAR_69_metabat_338]|uniref:Uma2 family endonuclease n=1 Tax=Chamaesiphon sp. VAR_69_metabat_338 TaxID=2964704 RepID=UPI00286E8DED|nr:Uma2 family endonuclease [Chamaesiphon sp. VAR_69_metabat_338]
MFQSELPRYLPSAEELPCSDDTPVDSELQELIPGLLKSILLILWAQRMDWFFGIDMAVYFDPDLPPIVPDGFLSLGVERFYDEELRPSYVLWDESIVPSIVLEVVSATYRQEYTTKLDRYAKLGVLYYVIYNSRRRRKPKLEIYKLVNGNYQLQTGNPLWMPEIGLGIGYERGDYGGVTRDWLYWYDEDNQRYPTPPEWVKLEQQRVLLEIAKTNQSRAESEQARAESEQARAESEQARAESEQAKAESERVQMRAERLAAKLRDLGIDPDEV